MWSTFPVFGSTLLLLVMVVASYTFATSLAAGTNGKPRTLQAARFGAYGTVATIVCAVLCLAYAFVSHDFRLRYVAHYSDRSMPVGYLLTALWGGQDGSLLWWLFLLSMYVGLCVFWLGKKYLKLQPYIIAALMSVILFFCVLMAFAANPFSVGIGGARNDGEGLNPLLQNFYMIIHPPSLYTGFVGCTIPFAFAVAALISGRLDHEWIVASRKWMLFAWMFLGIGNTLGMLWAYEELGWGGYWAWDPVENAAFMPFITATAYVHSNMIQERRGMLKVWNVFLICLTFLLTIFGTFLTRSGAIASVHSFAQSSIGTYFVWFLVIAGLFAATLIFYRWPELRDYPPTKQLRTAAVTTGLGMILVAVPGAAFLLKHGTIGFFATPFFVGAVAFMGIELVFRRMTRSLKLKSTRPHFESFLSREFTFLLNNWGLLGFLAFVLIATTFPMITEALGGERVTVGPPYYTEWVQPMGLTLFALMGIGTLFGWKKTSPEALKRAFFAPAVALCVVGAAHFALGRKIGFPAVVYSTPIYPGTLGAVLRAFNAYTPVMASSLIGFNATVIVQEFVMLFRSRAKTGANKAVPGILWWLGGAPGFLYTLVTLSPASRRRYGGYIVHFGIVLMFFGFMGKSWNIDAETTLGPGQTYEVYRPTDTAHTSPLYTLQYVGPRMEVDNTKRMVFADVKVTKNGQSVGTADPAKFMYKKMPDSPTTEVSMIHSAEDDLYLVVGMINPQTKMASLQIHVNPLVSWIWIGCIILIGGSIICMWPQLEASESRVWAFAKSGAAVAASIAVGIFVAALPSPAYAQSASSLHTGTVHINNDREKLIFSSLRCMCGDCARQLLTECGCSTAEDARTEIRSEIARGMSDDDIIKAYTDEPGHGAGSLAVPPNAGFMRVIWALPLGAVIAGGVGLVVVVRRWRKSAGPEAPAKAAPKDEYDSRLDEELKDLDG